MAHRECRGIAQYLHNQKKSMAFITALSLSQDTDSGAICVCDCVGNEVCNAEGQCVCDLCHYNAPGETGCESGRSRSSSS